MAPETEIAQALPGEAGLRALFDHHAGYVWSSLRRLGIHPSDLEDLTHDVFLHVHRHQADYDPARPVRPWLFGFAYRLASQYRRRAHRRHETAGDAEAMIHPGPSPDEAAAAEDDRRLLAAALERLAIDRRAVLVLYEIDGAPVAEIASTLGIPANTVYSRLRVARAELADAVKRLRTQRGRHG